HKHRPVSTSLRLRYRSAAFAVARWDFISILLTAKRAKSLFYAGGRRSSFEPDGTVAFLKESDTKNF
ncbi:hypothetical protein, partial [uncultured Rikenella sp.]|uniref:hypothetical protein n=1 Tax=uncultured Rikenella sp. TaxID=368003 RepID=UPI0025D373D4